MSLRKISITEQVRGAVGGAAETALKGQVETGSAPDVMLAVADGLKLVRSLLFALLISSALSG